MKQLWLFVPQMPRSESAAALRDTRCICRVRPTAVKTDLQFCEKYNWSKVLIRLRCYIWHPEVWVLICFGNKQSVTPETWTVRFWNKRSSNSPDRMGVSVMFRFQWAWCSLWSFALRLLPCSSQFHSPIYPITPEEDKPRAIWVTAASHPVLPVAFLWVSVLSRIQNACSKNYFERTPRVRGQYSALLAPAALHFCVHSGAVALMKCLSCQVVKTALGKLCLMVAVVNS